MDIIEKAWNCELPSIHCGTIKEAFAKGWKAALKSLERQPPAPNIAKDDICPECNGVGTENILGRKIMCLKCRGTGKR